MSYGMSLLPPLFRGAARGGLQRREAPFQLRDPAPQLRQLVEHGLAPEEVRVRLRAEAGDDRAGGHVLDDGRLAPDAGAGADLGVVPDPDLAGEHGAVA